MPEDWNAERFAELPPRRRALREGNGLIGHSGFAAQMAIELEDVRLDYCRMRLPFREEFLQGAGVVHGGVIATLIDTVVVPAIASGYDERPPFTTIEMGVQFKGAVRDEDLIAEGWVTQRGRSIVFCRAEVCTPAGRAVASGTLTYKIQRRREVD